DEPTAGIDPVARRQLWDLLFELSHRGVTLFVTTHYMDEAERCTTTAYIYNSKLLVCGKTEDLKRLPEVTPSGFRRWEIDAQESPGGPVAALSRLRGAPFMRDATLFGQAIHVLAADSAGASDIAQQAQTGASSVRPIAPTLEDVFVTLTSHASNSVKDAVPAGSAPASRDIPAGSAPASRGIPGAIARASAPLPASLRGAQGVKASRIKPHPLGGFFAIVVKEFSHIRRQPSTLVFMLMIPLMQTLIFGYALDTQIEHIPTVIYNLDGRQDSRRFVEQLTNTRVFDVAESATDEESFRRALSSGRAKVGVTIPPDFSSRLLDGRQTYVEVLIDGSDSQIATSALNAANLLGVRKSIELGLTKAQALQNGPSRNAAGEIVLPIEVRPRLLFNPDLESAFFFVPGLVGIILQLVTLFLTSFAIVREREMGTLEQLFVTPVSRSGLLLGKLAPYAIVGFIETLVILTAMVFIFHVPIAGSLPLLLALSGLFLVCALAMGLLISTVAKSQVAAVQFAFIIMLPSVLLSGFMFPRAQMPLPIYLLSYGLPVTYFLEILRGIILRAADARDLMPHIAGLAVCCVVLLTAAIGRFRKTLA
ncbi:MAG TPA: ABC transporter permease, partial [Phycisphaerae bacterium]|nr:ABC transporter permease [Phycisphaerae bacterium]